VGRFSFTTHGVATGETQALRDRTARWFFRPLQAKEWYRTRGFKELALVHGVVEDSYRKTSALINRIRHQADATPARTLCDTSESEGEQILSYLEHRADRILEKHDFTCEGVPSALTVKLSGTRSHRLSEDEVQAALDACDLSQGLKAEMADNPVPYESPSSQVYVTMDDVGVKGQKAHRERASQDRPQKAKKQYAYTTVAHVEHDGASYVLCGKGVVEVLRMVLALLLNNGLWQQGLIFLTDGQKTLQAAILRAFSWWGALQLILDWYHLEKKCKEGLSLALNGRQARNATLEELRLMLWHGLTDRAIQFLQEVNPDLVKNEEARQQLIAYLNRAKPYIPCYAIRKQLGLRNSSSIGEKMNDLVVSERQKHNGMSWSSRGSVALAALTALIRNQEQDTWFKKRTMALKLKLAS
jgi:hypothetical protein